MQAVQTRLFSAAFWPLTIWASFSHFAEHPGDDYVERTSPIVAFAVAFWLILAAIAALWLMNGTRAAWAAMWFFFPLVYGVGLWMYSERQGRYPS